MSLAQGKQFKKKGVMILSEKRVKQLIILSACLVSTLIVSNLLALKIISFFSVPVDAGILFFPLSYVAGDLLAEFFGEKIADFVALVAAMFGMLTLVVFRLATYFGDYPGANNSGFGAMAAMSSQVFLASIVSFLLGQISNNRIFEFVRLRDASHYPVAFDLNPGPDRQRFWLVEKWHDFLSRHGIARNVFAEVRREHDRDIRKPKIADLDFMAAFAKRALASSSIAHLIDALVFETVAFYGRLPAAEFMIQVTFAYFAGLVLELAFFPVTYFLAVKGRSPK